MTRAFVFVVVLLSGNAVFAQAPNPKPQVPSPRPQVPPDMIEVEPITCWWRTSATAVRTAEPFDVRLTCSVVETESKGKVVPDFSKLDPTVVQLPPYEALGAAARGGFGGAGQAFLPGPTIGCG